MTAERLIVLHSGDLGTSELRQLVDVVERESGHDLTGARITTYPSPKPTELLAQALMLKHTDELAPDPLSRSTTYTVEAAGGLRVVVAVWAEEVNPWVRRTIPAHLERVEATGFGVTRRPGWARLWSEAALSFVACARDGDSRRFPDVHVVVSVLPESRPRRIRKLMPGGYATWVDGVFARRDRARRGRRRALAALRARRAPRLLQRRAGRGAVGAVGPTDPCREAPGRQAGVTPSPRRRPATW